MTTMSESEVHTFLTADPPHTAKLATVRKDGRPHVAPVWFDVDDDGSLVFTTGASTAKGTALRRDRRVCLCVDEERPPFAFVIVEGEVSLSEDPEELLAWATRVGGTWVPIRPRPMAAATACLGSCSSAPCRSG